MSPAHPPIEVLHNEAGHRFEAVVDGELSRANYRREGDVLYMVHTEVPRAQQGRGIAAALVTAAIDYARENELKVAPVCSYVRAYMRRHPESRAQLAPGYTL